MPGARQPRSLPRCSNSNRLTFGVHFRLAIAGSVRVSVSTGVGAGAIGMAVDRPFARARSCAANLLVFLGIGPEECPHAAAQTRDAQAHIFSELIAFRHFGGQL